MISSLVSRDLDSICVHSQNIASTSPFDMPRITGVIGIFAEKRRNQRGVAPQDAVESLVRYLWTPRSAVVLPRVAEVIKCDVNVVNYPQLVLQI